MGPRLSVKSKGVTKRKLRGDEGSYRSTKPSDASPRAKLTLLRRGDK